MVFIRFNPANDHDEVCEFKEWVLPASEMGICGEPAMGQRGVIEDTRQYLCKTHWGMATFGVHASDIKEEKKK